MVVVTVYLLAYWETRPPRGINVTIPENLIRRSLLGMYVGITIQNDTGEDLVNCDVGINRINGEKIRRKKAVTSNNEGMLRTSPQEIPAGQCKEWYFIYRWNGTMRASTIPAGTGGPGGSPLPEGELEFELDFHANRRDGKTEWMPFWADAHIELVNDKHEVTVMKATK